MGLEFIIKRDTYDVPRLNQEQRERAMLADPKEFPQEMPCCVCGFRWMQHKGKLCPVKPGFIGRGGEINLPTFGDTEFVPDVAYYKEANFDVI